MRFSHDSFYRFKEIYDRGEEIELQEISKKKPCLKIESKNRLKWQSLIWTIQKPAHGQARVTNELRKQRILISAGGVKIIRLRHDLQTFQKRLKALETKMAQESFNFDRRSDQSS